MTREMKTAEQILDTFLVAKTFTGKQRRDIIEAMQEYADQFKPVEQEVKFCTRAMNFTAWIESEGLDGFYKNANDLWFYHSEQGGEDIHWTKILERFEIEVENKNI